MKKILKIIIRKAIAASVFTGTFLVAVAFLPIPAHADSFLYQMQQGDSGDTTSWPIGNSFKTH